MTNPPTIARPWPTEHEVADEVPIEATPDQARAVLESVPFWFHTFALNAAEAIYAPGVARDHGYRLGSIPASFEGLSVLDVGAFDGFYSYLAEHRGARRVLAVDNEQYLLWVKDRWGIELQGAEGFNAIHGLLDSSVEYRRMDALEVGDLDERFDFIFCHGILHRVEDPFGLLKVLVGRLAPGGRLHIETAGIADDAGAADGAIHVPHPGSVNVRDNYYFWQFSSGSLQHLAEFIDGCTFTTYSTQLIDGQTRIIGTVNAPEATAADPA
jgi:tRNA (mo5U34)-methyltransferase